jgi:hypothetical protein
VRYLAELGDIDQARALAADQVDAARRFGTAAWVVEALRAQGVVIGAEDGVDLLQEAVETLELTNARLEHAHAVCDLNMLVRHSRRPRDPREPPKGPLDLAARHGAEPVARRPLTN